MQTILFNKLKHAEAVDNLGITKGKQYLVKMKYKI